jgi:hypothetical protein
LGSHHDLAWAAGFFDGEGCVRWRIEKTKQRPSASRSYGSFALAIAQTDRFVLDRFQKIVEGGKVYGPYPGRTPKSKPYFAFQFIGRDAEAAFLRLLPYLSPVKSEQGRAALEKSRLQSLRPKLGNGFARRLELRDARA